MKHYNPLSLLPLQQAFRVLASPMKAYSRGSSVTTGTQQVPFVLRHVKIKRKPTVMKFVALLISMLLTKYNNTTPLTICENE